MLDYSLAEPNRRRWPAFVMSTAMHVVLLVTLPLVVQVRPRAKTESEAPRAVGITLAKVAQDVPYFDDESEADSTSASEAPASSASPA